MAMDHTNCTHPRTPAGRRACRAGVPQLVGNTLHVTHPEIKMVSHPAPAVVPAGRVAIPGLGITVPKKRRDNCPQAELHVDAHGGRCACGWVAKKLV